MMMAMMMMTICYGSPLEQIYADTIRAGGDGDYDDEDTDDDEEDNYDDGDDDDDNLLWLTS